MNATGASPWRRGFAVRAPEGVTAKNVATVLQLEAADHERRSTSDRAADAITAFCGSVSFIWTHVVWFVGWIGFNVPAGGHSFDPFPFPLLTLVVSLEAIFLSTFILISENRQARIGDRRNLLDLQINLLAEQENTKMLMLLRRIAEQMGVVLEDRETVALEAATTPPSSPRRSIGRCPPSSAVPPATLAVSARRTSYDRGAAGRLPPVAPTRLASTGDCGRRTTRHKKPLRRT